MLVGCHESNTLVVQVRTDFAPVTEMGGVGVDLPDRGDESQWDQVLRADTSQDWGRGVRVAEITGIASGPLSIRVGIDDPRGERLVERRVQTTLSGGLRVVTVLLTRSCVGVECPLGDPSASECLAGRCVLDTCEEEAASGCGAPECETREDCPPSTVACATRECSASGVCVSLPTPHGCPAGEVCGRVGCTPAELALDAGVSDAAAPDSGVDAGASDVMRLSAGGYFTCARLESQGVRCWGGNWFGQIGEGDDRHVTPVPVEGSIDAWEMATGGFHLCLLRGSGQSWCQGRNDAGQLGDGTSGMGRPSAVAVIELSDAIEVTGGDRHTCARLGSGEVRCWGLNDFGQLGDGTRTNRSEPVPVVGITDAVALTAGYAHTCARLSSGEVRCWGWNRYGQLGDGTSELDRLTPVSVMRLSDAVEVDAGGAHTCARLSSGEMRCWGRNHHGQLGDGTGDHRATPVAIRDLPPAAQVVTGADHSCARLEGGGVRCWGLNGHGQVGDGTTDDRSMPIAVMGISDAVELTAGAHHTCAHLRSGEVGCWGSNGFGQLGDGTAEGRLTPVRVIGLEAP